MTYDPTHRVDRISLNGAWTLRSPALDGHISLQVPGDVHSALLAAGRIDDPYWRDREVSLDWVHEADWTAETTFHHAISPGCHTLTFDSVDCVAEVIVNDTLVGKTNSQYLRYDFDVTEALIDGTNRLRVRFASSTQRARELAEASTIVTPYHAGNCRLPHMNHLRRAACHGGWDWNIALSPLGIYGDVTLRRSDAARLDDISVRQTHHAGRVTLDVTLHATCFAVSDLEGTPALGRGRSVHRAPRRPNGRTRHRDVVSRLGLGGRRHGRSSC